MKKIEFTANFRSYRKGQTAVLPDNIAKVIVALKKGEYYKVKKTYQNRMLTTTGDATKKVRKKRKTPTKKKVLQSEEVINKSPFYADKSETE